jgi:hypothetical protein
MKCNKILDEILEGIEAQRELTMKEHALCWSTVTAALSEVIDYIKEIRYNHELKENQCEEQES